MTLLLTVYTAKHSTTKNYLTVISWILDKYVPS